MSERVIIITFIIASSLLFYNGYRYNPSYTKEQLCKDVKYRCINYYSNTKELENSDRLSLKIKKYMDEKCKDYKEEFVKSNNKNGIFVLCVLLYVTLLFNYV